MGAWAAGDRRGLRVLQGTSLVHEGLRETFDVAPLRHLRSPFRGDGIHAVVRAGELPVNCTGRVRIEAEVDDRECSRAEIIGLRERP
jgi:hypothetical protein